MNLKRIAMFTGLFLLGAAVGYGQSSQWLHVRVHEGAEQSVKVNVPLALVETVLPLVDEADFSAGKVRLDDQDISVSDLRAIWAAVKQEGDYEMATVEDGETRVRVSIEGETLYVRSVEGAENEVLVIIPGSVVDALLAGEGDQLDVAAAVAALSASGGGELVRIQEGEKTVRVWIDSSNQGD